MEALTFTGIGFGFVPTDGDDDGDSGGGGDGNKGGGGVGGRGGDRLGAALREKPLGDWLVVAGATHVGTATVLAVREWHQNRNGHLLLVGDRREALFEFTERGTRMGWDERSFVEDESVPFLPVGRPEEMLTFLGALLQWEETTLWPLAACVDAVSRSSRLGVICRAVHHPTRPGSLYLSILNIGATTAQIRLRLAPGIASDLARDGTDHYTDLISHTSSRIEETILLHPNDFRLLLLQPRTPLPPTPPTQPPPPRPSPHPPPHRFSSFCLSELSATSVPPRKEGTPPPSDPQVQHSRN